MTMAFNSADDYDMKGHKRQVTVESCSFIKDSWIFSILPVMNVFYAHDDDVTYHLRKVLKDGISYKASTAYQSAASYQWVRCSHSRLLGAMKLS